MVKIRYYCLGGGKKEIKNLLEDIKKKYNFSYEIIDLSTNGQYDNLKEKEAYEKDFKPIARILKKKLGRPITKLRSNKARGYYISLPGTLAIIDENNKIRWYITIDKKEELIKELQNKCKELKLL